MMRLVIGYYEKSREALEQGASIQGLIRMAVREKIGRYKYTNEADIEKEYQLVSEELTKEIAKLIGKEDD